jgi:hypothetical protein
LALIIKSLIIQQKLSRHYRLLRNRMALAGISTLAIPLLVLKAG